MIRFHLPIATDRMSSGGQQRDAEPLRREKVRGRNMKMGLPEPSVAKNQKMYLLIACM